MSLSLPGSTPGFSVESTLLVPQSAASYQLLHAHSAHQQQHFRVTTASDQAMSNRVYDEAMLQQAAALASAAARTQHRSTLDGPPLQPALSQAGLLENVPRSTYQVRCHGHTLTTRPG